MRIIEVRKDVVQKCEPAITGNHAFNECIRARGINADGRSPQHLRICSAADDDASITNVKAAAKGGKDLRILSNVNERAAVRRNPLQRVVVERTQSVIQKRGTSIPQNRRDQHALIDSLLENDVGPQLRTQRQRNTIVTGLGRVEKPRHRLVRSLCPGVGPAVSQPDCAKQQRRRVTDIETNRPRKRVNRPRQLCASTVGRGGGMLYRDQLESEQDRRR